MIIDGNVYDVTKFLDEHPGGDEVLLEQAGQDASDAFEEIGHSEDARELLKSMLLGTLEGGSLKKKMQNEKQESVSVPATAYVNYLILRSANGNLLALVPVVAIIAFLAYKWVL